MTNFLLVCVFAFIAAVSSSPQRNYDYPVDAVMVSAPDFGQRQEEEGRESSDRDHSTRLFEDLFPSESRDFSSGRDFGRANSPGNEFSIFDLFQNAQRKQMDSLFPPSFFGFGFDDGVRGSDAGAGGDGDRDRDRDRGHPMFPIFFGDFLGPEFREHLTPLHPDVIADLPDNYRNSTSEVRHSDGRRTVVNQTIHKNSGDDFNHFFHFKTVHVMPHEPSDGTGKDLEPEPAPEATTRFSQEPELTTRFPQEPEPTTTFSRTPEPSTEFPVEPEVFGIQPRSDIDITADDDVTGNDVITSNDVIGDRGFENAVRPIKYVKKVA